MSIYRVAQEAQQRKRVEAGVRGRSEDYLRVIRARVDTTTPTILQGSGFTVVRNSAGDISVTFSPGFSGIPVVIAAADRAVGANGFTVFNSVAPTATTARLVRQTQAAAVEDGVIDFLAIGPV